MDGFQQCGATFQAPNLVFLSFQVIAFGVGAGGGDGRQNRRNFGPGKLGASGRIAIVTFVLNGSELFFFFDASGVVLGAEGAAGVVALLLASGELAAEPGEEVNVFLIFIQVDAGGTAGLDFLDEELGQLGGGGLETDFGKLLGIVLAEMVEELVLVEAMADDVFLGERPFKVTAGGPIGDVALGDGVAGLIESGDDVLVSDAVPKHVVNLVALKPGEAGDAAVAAELTAFGGRREGLDGDERRDLRGRRGTYGDEWFRRAGGGQEGVID